MKETLIVKARPEEWNTVNDFFEQQLEEKNCPFAKQMQILIAVEEIFVNIVSYAYGTDTGEVEIRTQLTEEGYFKIEFLDSGMPYNPLERENPDITLSAEERKIGGLGIFMVKKTMDKIFYEYINGKNCLVLLKKLEG